MRPRNRRINLLAVTAAAVLVTTACGQWTPDPSVLVKDVPLDLAFGRDLSPTPTPEPTPEPVPDVTAEVVREFPRFQQIVKELKQFAPVNECPVPDPLEVFPRRAPKTSIPEQLAKTDPPEGNYFVDLNSYVVHKTNGDADLRKPILEAGTALGFENRAPVVRQIHIRKPEQAPKQGYSFGVLDAFRNMEIRYLVVPDGVDPVGPPGFYFQELSLIHPKTDELTVVRPANPLLLMDFPIEAGATTNAEAREVEVTLDGEPIGPIGRPNYRPGDPIVTGPGQGAPAPASGTAATSGSTVLPITNDNRVYGCNSAADATRLNWTLNITGALEFELTGVHWFSPEYGGFPVADEIEVTTDAFSDVGWTGFEQKSTYMYLEPTKS